MKGVGERFLQRVEQKVWDVVTRHGWGISLSLELCGIKMCNKQKRRKSDDAYCCCSTTFKIMFYRKHKIRILFSITGCPGLSSLSQGLSAVHSANILKYKSHEDQLVNWLESIAFFAASDWVVANEDLSSSNRYCIKNLTAGDLLHVRVVAVNPGGRSEPGALSGPVPIREVAGE